MPGSFTPTNTPTSTRTNTPTNTPTSTPTNTPTNTPVPATNTPTNTPVPAWAYSTKFGSMGSGNTNFFGPNNLAVSTDTLTMWVADAQNCRVVVWTRPDTTSTAWAYSTKFGTAGSGSGEFTSPTSVAVSADGLMVWVTDLDNSRICIWSRPDVSSTLWSPITTFGSYGSTDNEFYFPNDIHLSSDELTVWIADSSNHRISIWNRPDTSSTVWSYSTQFGVSGSGIGDLSYPAGVNASSDGLTAWVADSNNNRISVWTRPNSGSLTWTNTTTFGTLGAGSSNFEAPVNVAASSDGLTAWVADLRNNRISIWSRPNTGSTSWANLTTFGSYGTGNSNFWLPSGIAVSSTGTTAWIADYYNNRVVIWVYS